MKEIQRLLLISMALSSLALVLAVICFPLVHFNLRSLTELVHNDMDHFKDSTDSLWNDLLFLENSGSRDKRDKREGDGFVYQYHPGSRYKLKTHHLHYNMHRWRKTPTRRYYYNVNSTKYRRRNNKWGRKVVIRNKDAPRHAPRRVFAAPTVEVKGKPGKDVFSDSEYIGSLVPMSQKEPAEPRVCKIVPNPKCPKGPPGTSGADGVDGDDGLPGTDGLPGEDGTEAVYNDGKCLLCPAGSPGEKGLLGAPGPSGETGPRGKPGILKELPGPRGPPGPKGEIGEPGISGPRGQMGISVKKWICPPGEKGQRGRRGSAGPAGPKGDTGETGIQGVRGRRGSVGPPGPLGPIGEVGVEGPPGRTGFEQHYCECPNRSKGVRGKFTLPQVPPYVGEDDDAYPKNLFTD